jgi:hypothetical protein
MIHTFQQPPPNIIFIIKGPTVFLVGEKRKSAKIDDRETQRLPGWIHRIS